MDDEHDDAHASVIMPAVLDLPDFYYGREPGGREIVCLLPTRKAVEKYNEDNFPYIKLKIGSIRRLLVYR